MKEQEKRQKKKRKNAKQTTKEETKGTMEKISDALRRRQSDTKSICHEEDAKGTRKMEREKNAKERKKK